MSHGKRQHLAPYRCRQCGHFHLHLDQSEKHSRQRRRRRLEELSVLERMELTL